MPDYSDMVRLGAAYLRGPDPDDCPAGLLSVAGSVPADPCILSADHSGQHRTATGVTWADSLDDESEDWA